MPREKIRELVFRLARRGVSTPAIVREVEQKDDPPARSTIYLWAKQARGAVDTTGEWRLVEDKSGRPDLALRVSFVLFDQWWGEVGERVPKDRTPGLHETARLLAVAMTSAPPAPRLTNGDAKWLARLAAALPDPGTDPEALLEMLAFARGYRAAEESGDERELRILDSQAAAVHFVGWAGLNRPMEA